MSLKRKSDLAISRDGPETKIFELDTTATLKWRLSGIKDGRVSYSIFYNDDEGAFFSKPCSKKTIKFRENIASKFSKRASVQLQLKDGSGTFSLKIGKLHYDDSGNFTFDVWQFGLGNANLTTKLDVQS